MHDASLDKAVAGDDGIASRVVETDIPARLDRLPWGRFHTLVVAALGITWILDGLEVTLAGAVAGALKASPVLHFSNADVGLAGSAYLVGAVLGALFFGWLTDRLGRKKLFFITLAVYLVATAATAFSWDLWSFAAVPLADRRRHRRRICGDQFDDPGTGAGARARLDRSRHQRQLLDRRGARRARRRWCCSIRRSSIPSTAGGWRSSSARVLGLVDLLHAAVAAGKPALADDARPRAGGRAVVEGIEARVRSDGHAYRRTVPRVAAARARSRRRFAKCSTRCSNLHRQRTLVGLALMAAQAFFYNAIFFTYALVLTDFYGVPADNVGWYILPFAAGNFLGPLMLGRLFDTSGGGR